jgi:hypothetical protein
MTENTTPADERDYGALSVALADLADTLPDDPSRVDGVHARVRRLKTRRQVRRATAGVVVGVATIAGLIAVRPGPTAITTIPASQPSTTAVLPSCSTLTPPPLESTTAPGSPSDAEAAKLAAAAADPSATGRITPVYGVDGIKGFGTVSSVSDASLTVTPEEQIPGWPSDVSATFTNTTLFYDGETEVTGRPAVTAGDQVAFAAVVKDSGGYGLLLLTVHLAETPVSPNPGEVTDAKKAAGSDPSDSNYVKATAEIVSVQPDSLTLNVREGTLTGQSITAALGPDVIYVSGDQKCVDPVLAAGDVVGVLLVHGDGDLYTVQQMALSRPA